MKHLKLNDFQSNELILGKNHLLAVVIWNDEIVGRNNNNNRKIGI